jgi:hypothetical protein
MTGKPCKSLFDLNKANDYHLALCLALMKALVEKNVLSQKEMNHFIKDAAKEVASLKFTLMQRDESKAELEDFVKAVEFGKA